MESYVDWGQTTNKWHWKHQNDERSQVASNTRCDACCTWWYEVFGWEACCYIYCYNEQSNFRNETLHREHAQLSEQARVKETRLEELHSKVNALQTALANSEKSAANQAQNNHSLNEKNAALTEKLVPWVLQQSKRDLQITKPWTGRQRTRCVGAKRSSAIWAAALHSL